MDDYIRIVGPQGAVEVFGIKMVGINIENAWKLLISLVLIAFLISLNRLFRILARRMLGDRGRAHADFLARQCAQLTTALMIFLGLASVWFDDPTRLATAFGLVTAGLAFALQKLVTAFAGYFVILRGKTFNVGDRIRMGGVRGDVVDLGFIQTTIMEMGEPPEGQHNEPAMWVQSRQFTGRLVTVSNARVFDEPVYNYSQGFPFIWEEMHLPVSFGADYCEAERILLDAAQRHSTPGKELTAVVRAELQRRYGMPAKVEPSVYYRLTDKWLEMTVRFVVPDHETREIKDAMCRDILIGLQEAGISIASGTYSIVGLPPIQIQGFEANGANAIPAKG